LWSQKQLSWSLLMTTLRWIWSWWSFSFKCCVTNPCFIPCNSELH
jgi:hypothetical protein